MTASSNNMRFSVTHPRNKLLKNVYVYIDTHIHTYSVHLVLQPEKKVDYLQMRFSAYSVAFTVGFLATSWSLTVTAFMLNSCFPECWNLEANNAWWHWKQFTTIKTTLCSWLLEHQIKHFPQRSREGKKKKKSEKNV